MSIIQFTLIFVGLPKLLISQTRHESRREYIALKLHNSYYSETHFASAVDRFYHPT